jgi:hypothetical protein
VNLYSANWDNLTYQNVIEFLNSRPPENLFLDYKAALNDGGGLEKDLAAFANTRGGLIFIGVKEDEERRPVMPPIGIPRKEGLQEQIGQIDTGNLWPPVSPDVRVLPIPKSENVLVAIRIPESELAPHWLFEKNKVYVRHTSSTQFAIKREYANEEDLRFLFRKRESARSLAKARLDKLWEMADRGFVNTAAMKNPFRVDLLITPATPPLRSIVLHGQLVSDVKAAASAIAQISGRDYPQVRTLASGAYWQIPEPPTREIHPVRATCFVDCFGSLVYREVKSTDSDSRVPLPCHVLVRCIAKALKVWESAYCGEGTTSSIEFEMRVSRLDRFFIQLDGYALDVEDHHRPLETEYTKTARLVPGLSEANESLIALIDELGYDLCAIYNFENVTLLRSRLKRELETIPFFEKTSKGK